MTSCFSRKRPVFDPWFPRHLLIRSMTSRVNILTSCSSSISCDSGFSSVVSSSPLHKIRDQGSWECKSSSDPSQALCAHFCVFQLVQVHSLPGGFCLLSWLEGSHSGTGPKPSGLIPGYLPCTWVPFPPLPSLPPCFHHWQSCWCILRRAR